MNDRPDRDASYDRRGFWLGAAGAVVLLALGMAISGGWMALVVALPIVIGLAAYPYVFQKRRYPGSNCTAMS